jgi:Putative Actinobacterial Holin-X, holin superfamily III
VRMSDGGEIVDHIADDGQRFAAGERSTGELVKQVAGQVSVLVRDELKLAQLEMIRQGKQAGFGAGLLGAAGLSPCTAWAA